MWLRKRKYNRTKDEEPLNGRRVKNGMELPFCFDHLIKVKVTRHRGLKMAA